MNVAFYKSLAEDSLHHCQEASTASGLLSCAAIMDCQTAGPVAMDQALLQIQYIGESGANRFGANGNHDHPVSNAVTGTLSLWTQSTECYKCPMVETCRWDASDSNVRLLVDTKYSTVLAIRQPGANESLCQLQEHFGEHGAYNLTIRDGDVNGLKCQIQEISKPIYSSLPILYLFVAYAILWLLYYGAMWARMLWKKRRAMKPEVCPYSDDPTAGTAPTTRTSTFEATTNATPTPAKRARLRSLDTFRGVSIAIMIFVNLGGGGYYFFAHSVWNGLTVADLVFPWFMFIMGTSMYLSINGALRRQVSIRSVWWHIVRRSIIMFLLGLFLNSGNNNDLRTFRIFGVLQRFGITYFLVGAFLCIKFWRSRHGNSSEPMDLSIFGDVKALWLEWLLVLAVVAVHTLITFLLPVPGCPAGYLGPGGLADYGRYENCTGGAAGYIDRTILTVNHTDSWPTCREIYQTKLPYDPEGILGQLTATLTVFLGVQAGATLVTFSSHRSRLLRWVPWGLACGLAAGVLCTFTKNEGWIPVNKNLWSLSYVFTMGAMSFLPLSALYFIVDIRQWWDGAPFYQAGMNSIILYLAHECFGTYLPFSWQPLAYPNTHAAQLTMNAWATSLFVILAIYMHYKKIFISI